MTPFPNMTRVTSDQFDQVLNAMRRELSSADSVEDQRRIAARVRAAELMRTRAGGGGGTNGRGLGWAATLRDAWWRWAKRARRVVLSLFSSKRN